MGIRESISKNARAATAVSCVLVIGSVGLMIFNLQGSTSASLSSMFYTDDDGASFFGGESGQVLAMMRKSKPAYRAVVYTCGSDKDAFVGYMTRYPAEAIDAFEKADAAAQPLRASLPSNDPRISEAEEIVTAARQAMVQAAEVKRPGAANTWTKAASPAGQEITSKIPCAHGQSDTPRELVP